MATAEGKPLKAQHLPLLSLRDYQIHCSYFKCWVQQVSFFAKPMRKYKDVITDHSMQLWKIYAWIQNQWCKFIPIEQITTLLFPNKEQFPPQWCMRS